MGTLLDIGQQLAGRRRALGVTQRDLAERLGLKQPQVARWEANGYRTATLSRVSSVAELLGIDLAGTLAPLAAETAAPYAAPAKADAGSRALARLAVDPRTLAAYARSHGIVRMELFGSVLTDEFSAQSDVDVLVTYARGRTPSLLGAVDYEAELAAIMRRRVDLLTRSSVERALGGERKRAILGSAVDIYAS